MKLSPRYDGDPIVRLDGPPSAIAVPLLRQRRRLGKTLSSFSPAQWDAPSRCDEWRVQDVVAHLTGTDQFWNLSVTSGVAGAPTRYLGGFDPKATPAAMVAAARGDSPAEVLASYIEANDALCSAVEALDEGDWEALAEAPVGHIAISAVLHHALWDSWVHERDVLEPLGIAQDEEADEIVASLRYAAALGPALALHSTPGRSGVLALEVSQPAAMFVVVLGDVVHVTHDPVPNDALVLTGDAIGVLEALSVRGPWRQSIPDDKAWMLAGLTTVFETDSPT